MTATIIRILLADDHAVLRSGLRLLLNSQAGMTVVGEASNGREALSLAQALQPDIVLLDLTMPGLTGMEALPLIRRAAPTARVLILTMHDDESYLRQVLHLGASGYVLKKAADTELISAVWAVSRGEVYVHPAVMRSLVRDVIRDAPAQQATSSGWDLLSDREHDVLKLIARGYTNTEVAEQLSLSVKTIETYRARGMEKLKLRTRAQLVQAALAKGLLD